MFRRQPKAAQWGSARGTPAQQCASARRDAGCTSTKLCSPPGILLTSHVLKTHHAHSVATSCAARNSVREYDHVLDRYRRHIYTMR